ncbi:MAG: FMN-binding negative transcriptional regulator [Bacteroidota bacterium]
MYIPKIYRNDDVSEILEFIRKNGFAQLISVVDNIPFASHLPVMLKSADDKHLLHGHMTRGNPQWKSLSGQKALLIFNGPHSYISASWYDHVNVPTWNYIAVHVYGTMRIIDGDELYASLKILTDHYEASQNKPITVEGMEDYVRKQMKGIVGFEMKVEKLEGKWKMSQNRDEKNHAAIIHQLEQINDADANDVAAVMKAKGFNNNT